MKRRKKELDTPQKVKTTFEELEVLNQLRNTVEWAIVKRIAERYIRNLQKISFKLIQSDPNFTLRHTEYTGQALGIKALIRMIDQSGEKLEKEEK